MSGRLNLAVALMILVAFARNVWRIMLASQGSLEWRDSFDIMAWYPSFVDWAQVCAAGIYLAVFVFYWRQIEWRSE